MTDRRFSMLPKLLVGLGVLLLGVAFTLDNVGVLDAGQVLRFWPLFLMLVGIASFFALRLVAGFLWIVAGVLFLLRSLGVVSFDPIDLWPLVLVVVGAKLIGKSLFASSAANTPSEDFITGTAFWTGLRRRTASQQFRGADFTAVMGGIELDLRPAAPAPGAAIDLFVFWGGVEITVPPDWTVESQMTPLAGGYEDKTTSPPVRDKVLQLRGLVLMGGVVVKN